LRYLNFKKRRRRPTSETQDKELLVATSCFWKECEMSIKMLLLCYVASCSLLSLGGAGVAIGRNAFHHETTADFVRALQDIVHKGKKVDEVMRSYLLRD
jgi:hypothetical protein